MCIRDRCYTFGRMVGDTRQGWAAVSYTHLDVYKRQGLGKPEEQHESVAVGSDRLRAQGPVLRQMLGEVGLYERGK